MVGTILEMLGSEVDEKELKKIIEEVDDSGDGKLQFEEFALLASRFLNEEEEEDIDRIKLEMKEVFRLYDKTGNGYITTEVLREILEELDDNLTSEDLDNMIDEIDADGSGTVDWDGKSQPCYTKK